MGPQAGGKNFLSEASKRWNDLPKEEKDKYTQQSLAMKHAYSEWVKNNQGVVDEA